jgi:regulator of replication initiation timing
MLDNEKIKTLRATAAIIEQLGWLVNENPAIKLNDLGSDLRKALTHFEAIDLPDDIEKSQLVQVLYQQLNAWKKTLKRNFKTPIANFAEETGITLLKSATLKKKDDPISIIVAQAFEEKISITQLKNAVNQLQEMGFVIHIKKAAPPEKPKKSKNISDDPLDILLNG